MIFPSPTFSITAIATFPRPTSLRLSGQGRKVRCCSGRCCCQPTDWSCGLLTCGIFLGAHWAYSVLGWGGYWGWDPVENASFLPWLTGTAFLHSVMMQEKRGMLKVWNMWLIFATFMLSIFGTFLTRSG